MAETITLSVTGGGTFTLFEQPLRASVAAPVFDIELSESVEAIGKVVQSRAVEITGQLSSQFGPDASALVTRTAQLGTDVDFFVSGVETQSREIRITQSTEAQFAGAEVKSRRTNIEGEATLDIRNSATSPIESRRATMTTNVEVVPVDISTRSGEFDLVTGAAVDARGVTVEARDAQITGVSATQFERDTTPPEVTDSNYNSGTKTLTTSITEESSQVTLYWASVANPNIVTEDDITDNTGDTIEVGSFVALSGDDSNTITLTDPTADEIHFFTVDPLGNQQIDIEIVTGIVVDDLQSREIQATSAAVLNAVGSQLEARDAQIAGSAVLDMEGGTALDPDAANYISRVETEDGQALEAGVVTAINDFFVSLKSNSLLADMGTACILAGARTIDGALEPLVSTMPQAQAFNFVSGDYDRKLGLLGDGSTKYIDTNRANNVSGQDDQTLSVYLGAAPTNPGTTQRLAGSGSLSFVGMTAITLLSSNYLFSSRADGGATGASYVSIAGATSATGLISVYRQSSGTVGARINGSNTTNSITSNTPNSENIFILARPDGAGGAASYSTARVSFFEEGPYKNPATLDTIVSQLMTDLDGAIA